MHAQVRRSRQRSAMESRCTGSSLQRRPRVTDSSSGGQRQQRPGGERDGRLRCLADHDPRSRCLDKARAYRPRRRPSTPPASPERQFVSIKRCTGPLPVMVDEAKEGSTVRTRSSTAQLPARRLPGEPQGQHSTLNTQHLARPPARDAERERHEVCSATWLAATGVQTPAQASASSHVAAQVPSLPSPAAHRARITLPAPLAPPASAAWAAGEVFICPPCSRASVIDAVV
ncbi:hypothetical protein BDV95DRAFT_239924 [Massariosphaeria phaeospora]|uniref:Uncharacterized protein n=1 Tax=Massariosphaeria phaeospora TaxID=100035 RepID=A0A7C8HZ55_9PLEO|nr:hypothetical protein BDV95DRAFT_239924 [Massariosphaeria phaeospora]